MPRSLRHYLPYVRKIWRKKEFESLFLFVTSRCNSLCRTCFYWDNLNKNEDLTFEQMERLSRTAPRFRKLWISGGEPFMRDELAEIITLFCRNNSIVNVNLPTNGLLPDKIDAVMDQVLRENPDLTVDLNFSIDGLANTHDTIRGVPNNFQKTLRTIERMAKYRQVRRLRRNVVTVITRENYEELFRLGLYLLGNAEVDGEYFEVIRGTPMDPSLKRLSAAELKAIHLRLFAIHEAYAERLFADLTPTARWFARMVYLGNLRFHFQVQEQNLERGHRWPMACTAGVTSLVVDHNGEFRSCELRPAIGHLKNFDFNVTAALGSAEMQAEVKAIPEANCWCTHSCFIQDSMKFAPSVLFFKIPWSYFKHRLGRWHRTPVEELAKFYEPLDVAPAA
ncbi:MAG TPA: radical SAM protein [Candidatus Acidoferrales bacterium]